MDIRLDGKRALVTGGNSGIGEAIALALAAAGARVAINYVTQPDAAQSVVQRMRAQHGDAEAIQADVSDPAAVARMFTHLNATWRGIDILINNAGIDGPVPWRGRPIPPRGGRSSGSISSAHSTVLGRRSGAWCGNAVASSSI